MKISTHLFGGHSAGHDRRHQGDRRPDVEAIVQFGANLPMARIADEAERWLDKPVISINVATYWHALRMNGINDRLYSFTSLFPKS